MQKNKRKRIKIRKVSSSKSWKGMITTGSIKELKAEYAVILEELKNKFIPLKFIEEYE